MTRKEFQQYHDEIKRCAERYHAVWCQLPDGKLLSHRLISLDDALGSLKTLINDMQDFVRGETARLLLENGEFSNITVFNSTNLHAKAGVDIVSAAEHAIAYCKFHSLLMNLVFNDVSIAIAPNSTIIEVAKTYESNTTSRA